MLGVHREEALGSEQQRMNGLGWGGEQDRGKEVVTLFVCSESSVWTHSHDKFMAKRWRLT